MWLKKESVSTVENINLKKKASSGELLCLAYKVKNFIVIDKSRLLQSIKVIKETE